MNKKYKLATKNPVFDKTNEKFDSSKGQRPISWLGIEPTLEKVAWATLETFGAMTSGEDPAGKGDTASRSKTLEKNKWSGEYKRFKLAHNVYHKKDNEEWYT